MKCYETLVSLAELASENGKNTYSITDYAFGFIPFKNGENMVEKVGTNFLAIAHWLLIEMEAAVK